jgi:transcription antitermination factor NusG
MPDAWHVLRTRPQAELAVAARLTAAGLAVTVPTEVRWWRPCRFRRRQRLDTGRPVIAGYAFLQAPVAAWGKIVDERDVWGVLLAPGGALAVVADAELRRLEGKPPIAVGSRLEVEAGPFAGKLVEVRAVDTAKRQITTDLALLGRRVPVPISVDQLMLG